MCSGVVMATVMVNLNVDFRLPEDVVQKARQDGLLTGEKIAELITAEIERRREAAAAQLASIMDAMHAHMRAQYPDLTDEEAQAMIDAWIAEADGEAALNGDAATP